MLSNIKNMKFNIIRRRLILSACLLLATELVFAQNEPAKPAPNVPGFTQPAPMDFNDHEGYVSLFNGKNLDGRDGNPRFWRVEDGAIIGESTPANPSGNS